MRATHSALVLSLVALSACRGLDAPGKSKDAFPACCGELGTCVPTSLASEELVSRLGQGECQEAMVCAPKAFVENPNATPDSCRSGDGREGRCLPSCLPEVASQADRLNRESCNDGLLCVPCYDPISGEDSQACRIGKDAPADAAATFEHCAGDSARCVPQDVLLEAVALNDAKRFGKDSCSADASALCVPVDWLGRDGPRADSCHTLGNLEGRCLPTLLPEVAEQSDRLQQESCRSAHLCVPCYDPQTGEDSRACRIGKDEPKEQPRTFATCAQGKGQCLPKRNLSRVLADADLKRLGQDSCATESEALCVPEKWTGPSGARVDHCRLAGELEGRCLPSFLPAVAGQAARLQQRGCETGDLCVPCFDPLTGESSGACLIGSDKPVDKARTFGECCGDLGRCLPKETLLQSLPEQFLEQLSEDSCAKNSDALCVPEKWLGEAGPQVDSCRAAGALEGRCLPSCLPQVTKLRDRLAQETCGGGQLCVPCFDPVTGADSLACRIGRDKPREPARSFAQCCGGEGRCVPEQSLLQSLSAEERARVGAGSCPADSQTLCMPTDWLNSGAPKLKACRVAGDLEGRCMPGCLPEVAARADNLQQRSCDHDELCVPCYDPLTGEDSKACRLGQDRPAEPAQQFEQCCGGAGTRHGLCLPFELLTASQIDDLPVDSCSKPGTRCAPRELIDEPYKLATCSSISTTKGLCMPECFLPAGVRLLIPRGQCGAPHRCAPCSQLDPTLEGCK